MKAAICVNVIYMVANKTLRRPTKRTEGFSTWKDILLMFASGIGINGFLEDSFVKNHRSNEAVEALRNRKGGAERWTLNDFFVI